LAASPYLPRRPRRAPRFPATRENAARRRGSAGLAPRSLTQLRQHHDPALATPGHSRFRLANETRSTASRTAAERGHLHSAAGAADHRSPLDPPRPRSAASHGSRRRPPRRRPRGGAIRRASPPAPTRITPCWTTGQRASHHLTRRVHRRARRAAIGQITPYAARATIAEVAEGRRRLTSARSRGGDKPNRALAAGPHRAPGRGDQRPDRVRRELPRSF
jgi:hypothetical protein